jgi:hypothetical protein
VTPPVLLIRESFTHQLTTADGPLPVALRHGLAGFRIPALPVANQLKAELYLAQLMHRFVAFARALHTLADNRAIALHVMAHHDRSRLGAEVGIYILCRAADVDRAQAYEKTQRLAVQVQQLFPTESLFNYDLPRPLSVEELELSTLKPYGTQTRVVELQKFLEPAQTYALEVGTEVRQVYIPHPYFGDTRLDPWLSLVEVLAKSTHPTLVSVALEPTSLWEAPAMAELAEQFSTIVAYGEKRRELFLEALRSVGDTTQTGNLGQSLRDRTIFQAKQLTDADIIRARRGMYAYSQSLTLQDQLFKMRVTLAAAGEVNPALVQSVAAALCAPTPETPASDLGWYRPEIIRPTGTEREVALRDLWGLGVSEWGRTLPLQMQRLRRLATAQEAVALFHLPMMPQAGQTSALSTVDVPFVIPPEVASSERHRKLKAGTTSSASELNWVEVTRSHLHREGYTPTVRFGYLYQRSQYLGPAMPDGDGVPFDLPVTDLKRPSLLVGAPGSGKSNLALYLLIQLWRDHNVPFLVLDPSTGHEYRYLYAAPALQDALVVYTVGDNAAFPLRFNPFSVPPGVTVRAHMTRLLACFKAAYEMWDPLPAIYEAALARVYQDPRFGWQMDEQWGSKTIPTPLHPSPCLADFVLAIEDEIEENVKPNYGRSEAGHALTGASQIRINGVLNSVGHVINVRQSDAAFFSTLLDKPVVIELGALGDPGILALVMAFLITQLAGYIEHAAPPGEKREQRQHLLLIDEAHRLLSGEMTGGSAHQGNVRGKSAEELNTLLAEVRKFGQGIMVLDQRPSSLVGGVLDNALINIMCRLHDREGFEHLSHVLNLSVEQQRHAHTSLKPGDALMLDAQSGQPVLLRAPNVVDALSQRHDLTEEFALMQRNAAQAGLRTPEAQTERKWGLRPCQFCRVPCRYGQLVAHFELRGLKEMQDAGQKQHWEQVREICQHVVVEAVEERSMDAAYCYLARIAGRKHNLKQQPWLLEALAHFYHI